MALLDDNLKTAEPKPIPGQGRSSKPYSGKSGSNPDWEGGQQRGPVSKQDNSTGRFSRPTIDQDYAYQAFREKMLGPLGLGDNSNKNDKPDTADNYSEEQQAQATADANQAIRNARASARTQASTNNSTSRKLPKINLLGGEAKAKLAATQITAMFGSWILYTWIFVQVPLAVLSILSFGIVAGLDSLISSDETTEYSNVFTWMAAKAVSIVGTLADSILKFIGIDFAQIAFLIGVGFYLVVLALGLFWILLLYFRYITAGIRPTTGQASGLKTGMLLLAILGYSTPFINMFPFVLLWMAAVWYHPK